MLMYGFTFIVQNKHFCLIKISNDLSVHWIFLTSALQSKYFFIRIKSIYIYLSFYLNPPFYLGICLYFYLFVFYYQKNSLIFIGN